MTEHELQKKIFELLKKEEWIAVDNIKLKNAEMPDIVAFRNGTTIFLEVRKPGGELTPLQLTRLETLIKKGFVAKVIYDPTELSFTLLLIKLKEQVLNLLSRLARKIVEDEKNDSEWKVQVLRHIANGNIEETIKEAEKKYL